MGRVLRNGDHYGEKERKRQENKKMTSGMKKDIVYLWKANSRKSRAKEEGIQNEVASRKKKH
jgi:uncharacterized protein YheU (UPF0270 family)